MKNPRKNRWSEYEPEQASNVLNLVPADTPLRVTFETSWGGVQGIDFSFMEDLPELASLFAKTMRVEGVPYSPNSRRGMLCAAKNYYKFLKAIHPDVDRVSAISYELLYEWAVWMRETLKYTNVSAARRLGSMRTLLKAAHSLFPEAFGHDFEIPIYVFTDTEYIPSDDRVLSEEILRWLLDAARAEVDKTMGEYQEGDVPEGLEPLVPFMILLAAKTAINPESLYNIERDCLTPHLIDTTAFYLNWVKLRSKTGVQRQLHHLDPRGKGVIELIQFLRAFTQPLAPLIGAAQQTKLFLYRYSTGFVRRGVYAARKPSNVQRVLKAFCKRYDLPYIRMRQIRPSVATYYYQKTGGRLRKVQLLLGHAHLSTTEKYVGRSLTRRLHNNAIRSAQDALVKRMTTVIPKESKRALVDLAGEIPPEQHAKIAEGAYDTGLCQCRNPFDSPQPGQQKGKCCSLFLACLTCPNALFFLEDLPRVIALRNHFVSKKGDMPRAAWEELYEDKIKLMDEDIIGAFSTPQVAAARRAAVNVNHIPILTGEGVLR